MRAVYFQRNFRLLLYGPQMNGVLAKPVEEKDWPDVPILFEYMVEIMEKTHRNELAAPQIGCFKQFLLVRDSDDSLIGLVNPEVTRMYGREIQGRESCPCLPPKMNACIVPRTESIDVECSLLGELDARRKLTFSGGIARIVQHGLDHLDGAFFIDRATERRRENVLKEFHNWKAMRRAQIRKIEESGNVKTGAAFAACCGKSNMS